MRRAVPVLAALLALVTAGGAAATLPSVPSGSAVGEGVPFKAYATIAPQVHLFGDVITARLALVADTKWVDPARVHVSTDFAPYTLVRPPTKMAVTVGRFRQLTWTWTLHCVTSACVPRLPPSEHFHVYRFGRIHIDYLTQKGGRAYGIDATWPDVEVVSQVSPAVATFLQKTSHLDWKFHVAPLAAPRYRISPGLLVWLALGAALAMLAAAAAFGVRWYRIVRPPSAPELDGPMGTPIERALAVLAWAHAHHDETLERKALERVAGELDDETPLADAGDLSRTARELAWSSRTPEDEDVETFSERARRTRDGEGTAE